MRIGVIHGDLAVDSCPTPFLKAEASFGILIPGKNAARGRPALLESALPSPSGLGATLSIFVSFVCFVGHSE